MSEGRACKSLLASILAICGLTLWASPSPSCSKEPRSRRLWSARSFNEAYHMAKLSNNYQMIEWYQMYSNVGNAVNKCGSTARLGPLQGLTRRMWKPVAILDVSVSQLCAQVALDKIHKGWRCSTWAPLNGQSFASPASLRYLQPARAVGHPRELPAIRTVVWELKKKKESTHIYTILLSYYAKLQAIWKGSRSRKSDNPAA